MGKPLSNMRGRSDVATTFPAQPFSFILLATCIPMSLALVATNFTSYGAWNVLQNQNASKLDPKCKWYGFADYNYDNVTISNCLASLWVALNNSTLNPLISIRPYIYYTNATLFNPYTEVNPCCIGCFSGGSVSSSFTCCFLLYILLGGTLGLYLAFAC